MGYNRVLECDIYIIQALLVLNHQPLDFLMGIE